MRTLLLGLACLALFIAGCRDQAGEGAARGPAVGLVSSAPLLDPAPLAAIEAIRAGGAAPAAKGAPPPAVSAPPPIVPAVTAPAPQRMPAANLPPFTSARQALVLDEASAGILYAKGAHDRVAPASLTKIATAIVAVERGDLDRVVTIDVDARTFRDSTLMGLRPGDRFTVRDLLYGLMLASGNDAAVAIGRAVSGSDPAFVDAMNALVTRLGLQDSHFANSHGLDAPGHYSSAYDMAMLSRYGMTLPEFRTIVQAQSYTAQGSRTIAMESLISGLLRWVTAADGVKSGNTTAAGRTLVLSADREGHRVYTVLMNDPQREQDGVALMEWGFASHDWRGATVAAPQPSPGPENDVIRAAREGTR